MSGHCIKTAKQREIMHRILAAADEGRELSFRELKETLSYGAKVSNQAVLCSLKFLEEYGYISGQKQGRNKYFVPTGRAYTTFRGPYAGPSANP